MQQAELQHVLTLGATRMNFSTFSSIMDFLFIIQGGGSSIKYMRLTSAFCNYSVV